MAEPATDINANDMDAVANSFIVGEEATEEAETQQTLELEDEELEATDEDIDESKAEEDSEEAESDEDETEETEDADQTEELYAVKVDGQEQQVTLNDLKRSYSGTAYIQKGMQETAETKKEAEAVYNALLQERQRTNELLQTLENGGYIAPPIPPDRALFDKDPIGYMGAKADYDEQLQQWGLQQNAIKEAQEAQGAQMQAALEIHLRDEMQKLVQIVPDFADAEKAGEIKKDLMAFGSSEGFSADELANLVDHRHIVVLRKAMLYDQMSKKKAAVTKKAEKAKPFVKAGAKKSTKTGKAKARQNAASRMQKSGSVDDVAKFLLS
mgnify:FL=1